MSLSGNFGSVQLDGKELSAVGESAQMSGSEVASLHVAVLQDGKVAHGPATVSGATWRADGLSASDFHAGAALGLACQTFVAVTEGALPSFVTFTWSEQVTIAGEGE